MFLEIGDTNSINVFFLPNEIMRPKKEKETMIFPCDF